MKSFTGIWDLLYTLFVSVMEFISEMESVQTYLRISKVV